MQKMMELGKDIETSMKSAVVGYNSGVEELKQLSSNDLSVLCNIKTPESDIVAVMDSVLIMMQIETGWENTIKMMTGKDFMLNISQFSPETVNSEVVQQAIAMREKFDPPTVKSKDKSAGTFAIWIDGIISIKSIHDGKLAQLQQLQ